MCFHRVLVLMVISILGLSLFGQGSSRVDKLRKDPLSPDNFLNPNEAEAMYKRIFEEREAFTRSELYRNPRYKAHFGHFFKPSDYAKLIGNPIIGYYYYGKFVWDSKWRDVYIEPFLPTVPETKIVNPDAWKVVYGIVCKKFGLKQVPKENAKIRISGRVISIDPDRNGLTCEIKIESPTDTMLYFMGMKKKDMGNAMGALFSYVTEVAIGMNGKKLTEQEINSIVNTLQGPKKLP